MDYRQQADALYAAIPLHRRRILYNAVMANPRFPFHERIDESGEGTWFHIAFVTYALPNRPPLSIVIDAIALHKDYTPAQRQVMYEVLIEEMSKILHRNRFATTLRNLPAAYPGMVARGAFNSLGRQVSYHSPMGNEFLGLLGAPNVRAPNRGSSRRLTQLRNKNTHLKNINTSLFNGGKRRKTRKQSYSRYA